VKTLGGILVLVGLLVYLAFGTLAPCGILREVVRKHDNLAALLPDGIVDVALAAQFGELSPGRCLSLLAVYATQPASTVPLPQQSKAQQPANVAPLPQQQISHPSMTAEEALKAATTATETAIKECREKRINGELKSFMDSAKCSNPRLIQAFKAANYRYMDLIAQFASKRLAIAERLDRKELTEEQAQIENKKAFTDIQELERRRDASK
jgi:hypothetical protein